jgi:hypothetical protein
MDVDEVLARGGAPVAQEAGLDVLEPERLPQQRVVQQVDLTDRQVIGGAPVGVDPAEQVRRDGARPASDEASSAGAATVPRCIVITDLLARILAIGRIIGLHPPRRPPR